MPHLHYSVRETCSEQGNSFPNTKQVNGSARTRTSLSKAEIIYFDQAIRTQEWNCLCTYSEFNSG